MSKKKKSEFEGGFISMKDLLAEQEKLQQKIDKAKIPCSHTNDNGKIKVEFLKGTLARCKKCGCVFNFEVIDSNELEESIKIVHNAINQIKALSNDPEKESAVIRELGMVDYNLSQVEKLYNRTVSKYGKGEKKNKKNKNKEKSIGSYGAGNINFIDSKRHKYN